MLQEASIIIPTYRGCHTIHDCLSALGPWRASTLIVDNASTDGTTDIIARDFPEVRVERLPQNAGFGRAVNFGVSRTRGGVIVVMNDDVICPVESIGALVACFADTRVGMAGGILVEPQRGHIDSAGLLCDASLGSADWGRGETVGAFTASFSNAHVVAAGPTGGLAAYRRQAFDEVGGFDPAFFAYYEDLDLALRLREKEWDFVSTPDSRAIHLGSATSGWRSAAKAEMVGQSRGIIARKYRVASHPKAWPALLIELAAALLLAVELRSFAPVRARWRGYSRATASERYPDPSVVPSLTTREIVRSRLRRRYRSFGGVEST